MCLRARRGAVGVLRLMTRKRRSMIHLPVLNELYFHPSVPSSHKRQPRMIIWRNFESMGRERLSDSLRFEVRYSHDLLSTRKVKIRQHSLYTCTCTYTNVDDIEQLLQVDHVPRTLQIQSPLPEVRQDLPALQDGSHNTHAHQQSPHRQWMKNVRRIPRSLPFTVFGK